MREFMADNITYYGNPQRTFEGPIQYLKSTQVHDLQMA